MAIRVLIADPDPILLASYGARLLEEGFEVSTATNGFDCLNRLRTFRPDLVVVEPKMTWGHGMLDVMHDVFELPLVPVCVITSHEILARLNLGHLPLVTHLQTKPVGPDDLVRLIRHIANEQRPSVDDLLRRPLSPGSRTKQRAVKNGRIVGATTLLESGYE